jgi:Zn-dependent protease with chaperone function
MSGDWDKRRIGQAAHSRTLIGAAIMFALLIVVIGLSIGSLGAQAQKRQRQQTGKNVSLTSHSRNALSPEAREMVEFASGVVCKERIKDPKASVPIDDMQARPSLPVRSPEAVAGAKRAQRLLPLARNLVVASLRRLAKDFSFRNSKGDDPRLQHAIARVEAVKNVRPDMDARDNASVFLRNPRTIVFGTIFLAGLPSDEGIISVLAHELVHIADGNEDSLNLLFRAVGNRASNLTGMKIHDQRAEELTCDLVGTLAARSYISSLPSYEPLPRRIARSLEHNCVDQDEGDDDHLSPRNTIRALLTLNPTLSRELVYGR